MQDTNLTAHVPVFWSYSCLVLFVQMAIENKIRQRLDLQNTRRQQLEFKEQKKQAEREEEEEFRRKVKLREL